MMQNWQEIMCRYNMIKNDKKRANKKLVEISNVISSAFLYSPKKADEMWQYIIDINVADNIDFARFYVAQVFTKLVAELSPEDATELLLMRQERLRLLLINGYTGRSFDDSLYFVLEYYIKSGDISGVSAIFKLLDEKYDCNGDIGNSTRICRLIDSSISRLTRDASRPRHYSIKETTVYFIVPEDNIVEFYMFCEKMFENSLLQLISSAEVAVRTDNPINECAYVEDILITLLKNRYLQCFLNFLYLERYVVAENVFYYLCEYAKTGMSFPLDYPQNADGINCVDWYRQQVRNSDILLKYEFTSQNGRLSQFAQEYLNEAIESGQWCVFAKYINLALDSADEYGIRKCTKYLSRCIDYYIKGDDGEPTTRIIFSGKIPLFEEVHNQERSRLSPNDINQFLGCLSEIYDRVADKSKFTGLIELISDTLQL